MSTFLKVIVIRDAQQIAQLNKKEEGGKSVFSWSSEKQKAFDIFTPSNWNCGITT